MAVRLVLNQFLDIPSQRKSRPNSTHLPLVMIVLCSPSVQPEMSVVHKQVRPRTFQDDKHRLVFKESQRILLSGYHRMYAPLLGSSLPTGRVRALYTTWTVGRQLANKKFRHNFSRQGGYINYWSPTHKEKLIQIRED